MFAALCRVPTLSSRHIAAASPRVLRPSSSRICSALPLPHSSFATATTTATSTNKNNAITTTIFSSSHVSCRPSPLSFPWTGTTTMASAHLRLYSTTAADLRPKDVIEHDSKFYEVTAVQKSMKGRGTASIRVDMKQIPCGTKANARMRTGEPVHVFMANKRSATLTSIQPVGKIDPNRKHLNEYLLTVEDENMDTFEVSSKKLQYPHSIFYLEEGDHMVITVLDTEDEDILVMRGPHYSTRVVQSTKHAGGSTDDRQVAILDNDRQVKIPGYVQVNEKISVKVEDESFVERAA